MSAAIIRMTMIQMAMPMHNSGMCVCQLRGVVGASALALCHFS